MPNLKASKKDLRKTWKRTEKNKEIKSRLKTTIKNAKEAKGEEKNKLLPKAYSIIDKALKAGIIKKNTAARYKSGILK